MVYFFINIPNNEIIHLETRLPKGSFCLFQVQSGSNRYYGMIKKNAYELLTSSLTPETRQNLELLEKSVFKYFFLQNMSDNIMCIGNQRLMVHLSDDNG